MFYFIYFRLLLNSNNHPNSIFLIKDILFGIQIEHKNLQK